MGKFEELFGKAKGAYEKGKKVYAKYEPDIKEGLARGNRAHSGLYYGFTGENYSHRHHESGETKAQERREHEPAFYLKKPKIKMSDLF